jgi:hypothetical protein
MFPVATLLEMIDKRPGRMVGMVWHRGGMIWWAAICLDLFGVFGAYG